MRGKPPVSRGSTWFALVSVTDPIARTAFWALQSCVPCSKPWCGGGRAVYPKTPQGPAGSMADGNMFQDCCRNALLALGVG